VVIIIIVVVLVLRQVGGGGGGGGDTAREERTPVPRSDRGKEVETTRNVEDTPSISVGVGGGDGQEMKRLSQANRKAKAPETASPRASVVLGTGGGDRKSGLTDKDAKIKSQLDTLPEGHRKPPPPWGIYYTDDGDLYYWNSETDESKWEYPA